MKISEIAQITGLSVSNIRFYERKGLVNPDRRIDSKYRDYTTQDVELIKRIVLYRKMDLSIEEIQNIVKDDMDDKQIVKNHLSELERKREMINNSMVLCEMFVDDEDILREVVYRDGGRVPGIFGNHSNPGHILEEMWFKSFVHFLIGLFSFYY